MLTVVYEVENACSVAKLRGVFEECLAHCEANLASALDFGYDETAVAVLMLAEL